MSSLKKRLDELYHERIVESIMEVRRFSMEMEKRNRKRFRRRIGAYRKQDLQKVIANRRVQYFEKEPSLDARL